MKASQRRFIVFAAGLIVCLLVLEISLRLVGSRYASLSESDTGKTTDPATTILCIGDSFTFGIGAPMELSYPAQLEKMLETSSSKNKISVINRGWPGQNSSQFLLRLENYLQEFQPNIVTILIGGQNLGNYFGYQDYLHSHNNNGTPLLIKINNWLEQIRIYKFIRLLFRDSRSEWSEPDPSQWSGEDFPDENKPARIFDEGMQDDDIVPECITGLELKEKGRYTEALDLLLGAAETKKLEAECLNIIGSIYKEQHQFKQAITWFKKGIAYDPTQFKNYEDIGRLYFEANQVEDALTWFKKGFENGRYESLHPRCYSGIGRAFQALDDKEGALAFFAKEMKREPVVDDYLHTLAGDYYSLFQQNKKNEAVLDWLKSDVEKMVQLCRQYKATPILQTYPFMPEINFIFKQLAEEQQISLVDHQKAFEPYTQNGQLSSDYFIPDGHPNTKGYHLMAENILKILQKDFLTGKN